MGENERRNKLADKKPIEEQLADAVEARLGKRPRTEVRIFPERRWRYDLVFDLPIGVIVEVDGSRHASIVRNRKDAEKRNAAIAAGYRCLTYQASSVLTKSRLPKIVDQISRVVCGIGSVPEDFCVMEGD